MTDFEKGLRFAKALITKAIKEKKANGYRENLGYDSVHKLENKLNRLNLSYSEESKIKAFFNNECDQI
jgi:hypothetical protein